MGKIRVHELAKELGKSSAEVIEILSGLGVTEAKAQSSLEEDMAAKVRGRVNGAVKKPAATPQPDAKDGAKAEAKGEAKADAAPAEAPKKKKFVAVFRRENARSGVISRMPTRQAQQRSAQAQAEAQGRPLRRRPVDANGNPLPIRRPVDAQGRPLPRRVDANGNPIPVRRPAEGAVKPQPRPASRPAEETAAGAPSAENTAAAVSPQTVDTVKPQVQAAESAPVKETAQTAAPVQTPAGDTAPAAAEQKQPQTPVAETAPEAASAANEPAETRTAKPQSQTRPEASRVQSTSRQDAPRGGSQDQRRPQGRPSQNTAGQGQRRPYQGDRPARGESKPYSEGRSGSDSSRRPYQGERRSGGQAPSGRSGQGSFQGRNAGGQGSKMAGMSAAKAAPVNAKPGARNGAPSKGKNYDQNREGTRNGRGSQRREGKDRNEKYNRFDANDRVQTGRRKKDPNRAGAFHKPEPVQVVEEQIKTITLPDSITLKELADKMKIQASAIIKKLFMAGKMVTLNQDLTYEEAEEIAVDYDILCEHEEKKDLIADLLKEDEENEDNLVARPPVVCVMGHVDHGKTSLLDAIRDTHVTDKESGGITQHIGASVIHYNDRTITFLDTPGHEAFTAMRMRGANSTDIAVLVVAADDGVMPQTIEAINHAKAAGIEIIVAINKIDKPSANIDRVKQELTEYELIAEDWGGSTTMVPVSAKSHEGIDNLLEMILLTADVMELKSNPNRRARGLVIEAKLDKGRGPVASLLVQKGTLHVGDPIDAGSCYGKIRAMTDDKGRRVKEAGPSMPVEVIGFSDVPGAGEIFTSPETEKEAKNFAATFINVGKEKMIEESRKRTSLDDLFSQIQEGTLKDLNLIVKADVQGSVEALRQSLLKLSNDEVVVKIIHSAVGAINESDVTLAGASNAIIIGFNVRPDAQAKSTAEHEGVDIRLYKVIYDAINDVENAMKGMLEPIYEEKVTGHVEIRQIFKASGVGNIAGSYVLDGTVQRGSKARITRDDKLVWEGSIASLKRFKDDVKEVRAGYECGLVFDGFSEIREGDQVEAYVMVEIPRS